MVVISSPSGILIHLPRLTGDPLTGGVPENDYEEVEHLIPLGPEPIRWVANVQGPAVALGSAVALAVALGGFCLISQFFFTTSAPYSNPTQTSFIAKLFS